MNKIIALFLVLLLQGCAAVNVRTDDQPENQSPPSFQQTYTYWWWGVKGEYRINVREICAGHSVEQMQTIDTFTDSIMRTITLGIYWPRTARVWCGETES